MKFQQNLLKYKYILFKLYLTVHVVLSKIISYLDYNRFIKTSLWFETPPQHSNGHADTDRRTRKTDSYGKDGHLWKTRALMENTGIKHLKRDFYIVEII